MLGLFVSAIISRWFACIELTLKISEKKDKRKEKREGTQRESGTGGGDNDSNILPAVLPVDPKTNLFPHV